MSLRDDLIRTAAVCFAAVEDLDASECGEGWLPTWGIGLNLEDDIREAVGKFYAAQDGFRHRSITEWLRLVAAAIEGDT